MGGAFIAAVGAAAAAAGTAVTGAFTTLTGGSILGALARVGIGIGLSLLARQFAPKPKPTDGQIELSQALPPRRGHYGRIKTSGFLAFNEAADYVDGDGEHHTLFKDIMISAREIDAYEQYHINDRRVALNDDSEVITAPYIIGDPQKHMVKLTLYVGTDDQTADPTLMEVFSGQWTADHRLRGIAHIVGLFKAPTDPTNFSKVYASSSDPNISVTIRANKIYDPRKDITVSGGSGTHRIDDKTTWEWSDNAGLCILDFLTHVDHYARPAASFIMSSFMDFADLCDEGVLRADGVNEARYRVAMSYDYTEPRKEVLKRLLEACDGFIYRAFDGRYGIRGGKWTEPTVVLDHSENHIYELELMEPDALDRYNELVIAYMSPAHGYVEQECDPWINEADIAATGEIHSRAFDLTHVPSYTQARRLAKIRMARDNPRWTARVKTNFFGVNCIGEEIIGLLFQEMLVDEPLWVIGGPQIAEDFLSASISLRSANEAAYSWTTAEEGEEPAVPPDTSEFAISLNYGFTRNSFNFLLLIY